MRDNRAEQVLQVYSVLRHRHLQKVPSFLLPLHQITLLVIANRFQRSLNLFLFSTFSFFELKDRRKDASGCDLAFLLEHLGDFCLCSSSCFFLYVFPILFLLSYFLFLRPPSFSLGHPDSGEISHFGALSS